MNPLIQFKTRTLPLLTALALMLICYGLSPTARAQLPSPTPDGGYPNGNTAEGDGALFSLTTGIGNTAVGFFALFSNTTGNNNTTYGFSALDDNTTCSNNIALGPSACVNFTTGSNK